MKFSELQLIDPILKALDAEGYTTPTPIQEQSIPVVLSGKDLFGCAQTGTGKTASFAIPIIQILAKLPQHGKKNIHALILTPTRELAIQIGESFAAYGKFAWLTHTVIFGGVSQLHQVNAVRKGVDIMIATPGRLLDLINQKHIDLRNIKMFVLDEADRMLDMWFIHDVKKIISHIPAQRQTLFFSATMPQEILKLAHTILKDPISVKVTPVSSTVDTVGQSLYYVPKEQKRNLLLHLLQDKKIKNALVFTKTKHGANKVAETLAKAGIPSAAIHGNKSQTARQNALASLKNNTIRILVATDIAARGIDVDLLSHVIIYDLPNEPETYVHRIGRTGRAGASGVAIAFCDYEEKKLLKQITDLIKKDITVVHDHPFPLSHTAPVRTQPSHNNRKPSGRGRRFSR
jgi:ATP-dependent RNA helicase RhlE